MARTITGGAYAVATITSAISLIASDDPLLITTGAQGAMGTIIGAAYGIYGDTSQAWTITNFGKVEATSGNGIRLLGGGTVLNDGTITGGSYAGILLTAGGTVTNGTGTDTVASIHGGTSGVEIGHYFLDAYGPHVGGAGAVTNGGTITGGSYTGVLLKAGGSVTNGSATNSIALISGYTQGIRIDHGAGTVVNYGTVLTAAYLYNVYLSGGGDVSNLGTAALISGGRSGVRIRGAGTVTNEGTIAAPRFAIDAYGGGTVINSGTVRGRAGVVMGSSGTVLNAGTAARITGTGAGVFSSGALTNVTNEGTILGTGGAVAGIWLLGAGTITNLGTAAYIGGTGAAIRLEAGGSIANDGTILGSSNYGVSSYGRLKISNGSTANSTARIVGANIGAFFNHTVGVVTNFGTITGGSYAGVHLSDSGDVSNLGTAALISGARVGVYAAGAPTNVTNEGTILGTGATGRGIWLRGAGTITNLGTAAYIGGTVTAILLDAGGSIANDGIIIGNLAAGILLPQGGTVTNGTGTTTAASIHGGTSGVEIGHYFVDSYGPHVAGAGAVLNDGTIIGGSYAGVLLKAGGSVTNGSTTNSIALISGYIGGIKIDHGAGTVVNYGTLLNAAYGTGVYLSGGGDVSNLGTAALISGAGVGVYATDAPINVTNEGTVLGTDATGRGIQLRGAGTITNLGTAAYIGGTVTAILLAAGGSIANDGTILGSSNDGVSSYGRLKISNGSTANSTARIEGANIGAFFNHSVGVVTNFGTITGGTSGVALADRRGIINNRGLISGAAIDGVYLGRGGLLTNSGTITGTDGVEAGSGATTLTNRGTIIGTGGTAVRLGTGDDIVAISRAAVFSGVVNAGSGTDTLVLLRGGVGNLTGLGTNFTGFEVLTIDNPAAKWTMSGTNTLPDGALIDGAGRLTVTGTLTVPGTLNIASTGTIGVSGSGMIEIGTTGGAVAGKINIDNNGTLSGHGTLRGAVVDNGLISITGGPLTLLNAATGTGTIAITASALLNAQAPLFVSNLLFAGAGTDETLIASAAVKSTIAGFADHDSIDLTGFLAIPGLSSFAANKLILDNGAGGLFKLSFAPGHTIADFDIAPDGFGGTSIVHHL